ncbi:MAG: PTS sugar transporter subunit IIB [Spiroplasma sp.]
MKKILLICSAGMSTSLLEKSVNDYIKKENLSYQVEALSAQEAKPRIKEFDILLLGPQVRYMLDEFTKLAQGKKITVIPPNIYATAKGAAIIELIETL